MADWKQERNGILEWNPSDHKHVCVNIAADHVVEIDKLYGPWAVWPVRVRLDYKEGCWIIEQAYVDTDEQGNDSEVKWTERARFDAWPPEVKQLSG